MQTFELKFSGVTILQGVEFHVFLLILSWALQQCSALPVISWSAIVSLFVSMKSLQPHTETCNHAHTDLLMIPDGTPKPGHRDLLYRFLGYHRKYLCVYYLCNGQQNLYRIGTLDMSATTDRRILFDLLFNITRINI